MALMKGVLNADSVAEQFGRVLQKNKEAFVASLLDLYGTDKNLQQCEPKAVVTEAMKAATLKLPVSKSLGFAYIVPRKVRGKMTPTFQIGYKGFIQLAMRTGQYKVINADLVYEGELKSTDKLTGHIDLTGEKKSDKVIGYFAHFELNNGFSKTLYMTQEQMMKHAKRYSASFTYDQSPWKTNFDEMALKTVLRNLIPRYGYLSIEMADAISKEDDGMDTGSQFKQLPDGEKETLTIDSEYEDVTDKPHEDGAQEGAKEVPADDDEAPF